MTSEPGTFGEMSEMHSEASPDCPKPGAFMLTHTGFICSSCGWELTVEGDGWELVVEGDE